MDNPTPAAALSDILIARLEQLSVPRKPTEDGKPSVEALVADVCAHVETLTAERDEARKRAEAFDRYADNNLVVAVGELLKAEADVVRLQAFCSREFDGHD